MPPSRSTARSRARSRSRQESARTYATNTNTWRHRCLPGRFYFHTLGDAGIAATLEEFSRHLRHCDPAILAYHLSREDFSRWVTQTLADHTLGRQIAAVECDLSQHHAAALERARHQIMHAIDSRYPGSAGDHQDGT